MSKVQVLLKLVFYGFSLYLYTIPGSVLFLINNVLFIMIKASLVCLGLCTVIDACGFPSV